MLKRITNALFGKNTDSAKNAAESTEGENRNHGNGQDNNEYNSQDKSQDKKKRQPKKSNSSNRNTNKRRRSSSHSNSDSHSEPQRRSRQEHKRGEGSHNKPSHRKPLPPCPGIENASVLERDEHQVSRKDISPNALKVLYRLRDLGFHSYLVGGGVRDLLLNGQPKDFDIATDATPEQLRKEFRNARIIGKRFKIVHLRYGREIIEVTTFRAPHDRANEFQDQASRKQMRDLDSAHSSSGMILRDNVYGNIDEDALRRDFTVNALYYTIEKFKIYDFADGVEDLNNRLIRMIGDPESRYLEDPVRMLRAIRIAAKLDFEIEENTLKPIDELADHLDSISNARLFDELVKLLGSGYGVKTFARLRQFRIARCLIPDTLDAIESNPEAPAAKLFELALRNTDERLASGKSVTPAFLIAALLWPVLQKRIEQQVSGQAEHQSNTNNPHQLIVSTAHDILTDQWEFTAIPKRFSTAAREIWELQLRLERRNKRSIESAYNHPRFRAAYDFLLLREESGEQLDGIGEWWTKFQIGDTNQQQEMIADANPSRSQGRPKQGQRRRKKKPSAQPPTAAE